MLTLTLTACRSHPLPKVTHSWWLTKKKTTDRSISYFKVFPIKLSLYKPPRSFCLLRHPQLPHCYAWLSYCCTPRAQLTPHPLQLTLQVVSKRVQWEKTGILKGFHCPRTPLSEVVHKSGSELICIFPLKQAAQQLRRALLPKRHLLWFALRPSPGLEQLWKHLYAAHLNICFRQIFRGSFKGERLMLSLAGIHYPSCEC